MEPDESVSMETVTMDLPDNRTDMYPTKEPGLKLAYDILIPAIVAVIMLSMGCGIRFTEVRDHLKKPIAPVIGETP